MNEEQVSKSVKLGTRYLIIGFVCYLAYLVTSAEYLSQVSKLPEWTLNTIVGVVFGALTLIIKFHFDKKVEG